MNAPFGKGGSQCLSVNHLKNKDKNTYQVQDCCEAYFINDCEAPCNPQTEFAMGI